MKKLFALLLALMMVFSFVSCGKGESAAENEDGNSENIAENNEEVEVSDEKFEGQYVYNPPKDNYCIKWTWYDSDGTEGGFDIYARIGQGHTEAMSDIGVYHASEDMEQYYERAWEGEYSDWMPSPGYGYSDWVSDYDENNPNLGSCSAMEDNFMHYFRAYGFDETDGKLNEYFVGTETVAGIECWVFDSKGINTLCQKYWIDPSNGVCLKCMDTEDGSYAMVTEYNLNYTEWTDNLAPSSYEDIG